MVNLFCYHAKTLFLDIHAKVLQILTNLDIFKVSTMSRFWQDLPRLIMCPIKVYQVAVRMVKLEIPKTRFHMIPN